MMTECAGELWTGKTPEYLWLFRVDGQDLVVPTGTGKEIRKFLTEQDQIEIHLADPAHVQYDGELPLYDYQRPAVDAMKEQNCGILQAPCGSGKTQMGIGAGCGALREGLMGHAYSRPSESVL